MPDRALYDAISGALQRMIFRGSPKFFHEVVDGAQRGTAVSNRRWGFSEQGP
jgi:hypothetical protein